MKNLKKLSIVVMLLSVSFVTEAQTQFINDISFEETGSASTIVWQEQSKLGFDPINNLNPARTGSYSLNFVSLPNTAEMASCIQPILTLKTLYNCKLEFYIKCLAASGSSTDIIGIMDPSDSTGSKILYSISGLKSDSAALGGGWKKISLQIDSIPKGIYSFGFFYQTFGLSGFNHYMIDDVTLTTGFPTAVNDLCIANCDLNIYPTATHGNIYIENITEANCTAELYTIYGQSVQKNNLENVTTQKISLEKLAAATYFLQIKNKNGLVIKNTRIQKL